MTSEDFLDRPHFHVARCGGGWNVHGFVRDYFSDRDRLALECLHLHPTAADARVCQRRLEADSAYRSAVLCSYLDHMERNQTERRA